MRILGQIPHPDLLITVFKSGNKYILKFEVGPFEQTYKFIEADGMSSFEDVKKLVDGNFIKDTYQVFDLMNIKYQSALTDKS
jgi:hypothetical protein